MSGRSTFKMHRSRRTGNVIRVKRSSNPKGSRNTYSKVEEDSWRDSNEYRRKYFEQNKGICGILYICSQCFKPMINKSNIQVDHIIPPSRFVKRRNKGKDRIINTNFLSRTLNNTFNCAAICPKCNRIKSNNMGLSTVIGIAAKAIEVSAKLLQYSLVLALSALLVIAPLPFRLVSLLTKQGKRKRHYKPRSYSY